MTIFRSPATAPYPPFDSSTTDAIRLLKDGRKAKRVLRRRMQPKQQRCSERMVGPIIEPPCREIPQLPRGGDGLAMQSLRPSLGPQGRRESTGLASPSSPRRPATPSCIRRQSRPQLKRSRFAGGHRRLRASRALEEHWEDSFGQHQERHEPRQDREQQPSTYPQRPAGEAQSARHSHAYAGHRTIRNWEESEEENFDAANRGESNSQTEESRLKPVATTDTQPRTQVESTGAFSHLHSTRYIEGRGEEDAWCQLVEEEDAERAATVVLSSAVPLSPRGRARTPTILATPTNGSYIRVGSPDWEASSQDGAEYLEHSVSPRPHTVQGIEHDGQPVWHVAPAASWGNATDRHLWTPPGNDIGNYMASKEFSALVERLWTRDRVTVPRGSPSAADKNHLACIAFGTDEFAGDREIECFIAWVTAAPETQAAAPATAASAAATERFPAEGTAAEGTAESRSVVERPSMTCPEATVTLVAVPVHTVNSSRRYNPYHLSVVGREVDKSGAMGLEEEDEERLMLDGPQDAFDVWNTDLPQGSSSGVAGTGSDGDGRGCQGQNQASTTEKNTSPEEGKFIERVCFSSKGVTFVNVHGETSFHGLEEWRRDKDRFDALRRMKFVRRFSVWKCIRAMARFIGSKRVDRLKNNVERGLAILDPVCSSAVQEIVVELQRMQSLRFLTALKGSTATYTLDEFFDEQTRNMVECQRELLRIYDRCGRILGRTAKNRLHAEGLLVTNRAWNQMSPVERAPTSGSQKIGSPAKDRSTSVDIAGSGPSPDQVQLPAAKETTARPIATDSDEDIAAAAPTSWSFAACQRSECARIARVFRYARQIMRQELRGLALSHAESLLGAVTRTVVRAAEGDGKRRALGAESPVRTSKGQTRLNQPQVEDVDANLAGEGCDRDEEGSPSSHLEPWQQFETGGEEVGGDQKRNRLKKPTYNVRRSRNLRYEARPYDAWNRRWALSVDEEDMGELTTLALEASMVETDIGAGTGAEAGEWGDLIAGWRKAFRKIISLTSGCRSSIEPSVSPRFCSRISLPENCLSVSRAIQLACELVPHAEETLAVGNPMGAKPVLIDMFEAEIPPNLRGVDFFPITHRFHGEQKGVTEDVFILATLKLSAACQGGIDAQLSDVSSDWEESDDEEGGVVKPPRAKKEPRGPPCETARTLEEPRGNASVLDASSWDVDDGVDTLLNTRETVEGSQGEIGGDDRDGEGRPKSAANPTMVRLTRPPEVCGISTGPCGGIRIEVDIRGNFEEWDLQVFPPLQGFVDRAKRAQLQVLNALARVPCLLDHPEVKPYQEMVDGYGLGFDLPQGGIDDDSEAGNTVAWGLGNEEVMKETEATENLTERSLPECDWLENLSEDPYFRGLQDKVFLSLASSHNAVYRMVDGFRPLLEEFQALGAFAAQRDARDPTLQVIPDPDTIAAKLVTSGRRATGGGGSLNLTPVLLAKSTIEWLRGWYSRFEHYRRRVRATSTDCPQVLFSVTATNLIAYLVALPAKSLEEIRTIGPRLMLQIAAILGAVIRRCNAVLSGGLVGVDALGEKAGFLGQIEQWLWPLREEVKRLQDLGIFLKNIGCFNPRQPLPSAVVEPRRGAVPVDADTSSASKLTTSATTGVSSLEPAGGGDDTTVTSGDHAGTPPDSSPKDNGGERAPLGGGCGGGDNGGSSDFRAVESKVHEVLESLTFHLSVLQRSVDQAHINMRIASQEFSSLLKKALESLAREIDRLEADILDPSLSSAATDPAKACSRLEAFRHRLSDLQEEESRYRHYNQLVDKDLVRAGPKGGGKQPFDEEKMQLDLARVGTERRKLVLKWEAQLTVFTICKDWESSSLISREIGVMSDRLGKATRAHALAVTTAGNDEVSAACEATLGYLGKIVEVVGFLHNRNLTAAYWERIERIMPLSEDLKAEACNESMPILRRAAGLELPTQIVSPAAVIGAIVEKMAHPSVAVNGDGGGAPSRSAEGDSDTAVEGVDGVNSVSGNSRDVRCSGREDKGESIDRREPQLPRQEGTGDTVDLNSIGTAASKSTGGVQEQPSVGSVKLSSLVAKVPQFYRGDSKAEIGKAAPVASPTAGRGRRGEARRRQELYEVFPMAAEWGGLSIGTLLRHGLLERRREIGSISTEATASAVLRKALEELEGVWEAAPMMFAWRFDESHSSPGNTKQLPILDADSMSRRQLYSRVLAEPALIKRGYSTGGFSGDLGGGGGGIAETTAPSSEGFTSLLSNGDELLRLAEHCRVVADSVVDAPSELLAVGGIGKAALEWQKRICWFQEVVTQWMAVQEQWVRLAPAFVPPDLDIGVPSHERIRFTDVSRSFQSILGMLRADENMNHLAGKHQGGTEKGGRSLLAKICKLQEDLEVISLTMDRWLSSSTAVCPRLLALPRHQLFRLFRDWASGRVGSGEAAGEMNERFGCMFRGVGELVWKETVSTTGGTTVRTNMAAAGVRSSGAGLEMVPFGAPVLAVGRFEIWVRNVDRQLMYAIAHDVEMATAALRKHGRVAGGPGYPPLLHIRTDEEIEGGKIASTANTGVVPTGWQRPGVNPSSKEEEKPSGERSHLSVQGQLLARSAHWTAAVETALCGSPLASPKPAGGGSAGRGEGMNSTNGSSERLLQEILSSVLLHVNGWAEELRLPGGVKAYNSLMSTALTTQALHQRDVVEELLKTAPRMTEGGWKAETTPPRATAAGGRAPSPTSMAPPAPAGGGEEQTSALAGESELPPFVWLCHLRHYHVSTSEAGTRNGRVPQGSETNAAGRQDIDKDGEYDQELPPPPLPLIRVSLGPWDVPYGFEYAGNLERLWLTPLSERCLLHAVHSAKGRYGGLLISTAGSHRQQHNGSTGYPPLVSPSPGDISGVAQDVAIAFGRPFRALHSGCITSPQAVSSVIASTLMAGGVTVFAGIDQLPKVSLAVLAESLRAVLICLHAGKESVSVNGKEVLLSTRPDLLPNYDPILHQWKLLASSTGDAAGSYKSTTVGCGGGGPFLGFFATLAKQGPAPQLPLSVRSAFRPVLTTPPNASLLLEAMLLTNGFAGARALVQGLIHGLRELRRISLAGQATEHGEGATQSGGRDGARREASAGGLVPTAAAVSANSTGADGTKNSSIMTSADAAVLLRDVVETAVRTAAGLLALETAREIRAARRKLGLASLTSSERKEKTDGLSRAVEARVLIAGVARALLSQEMGGRLHGMNNRKKKRTPSRTGSGATSPAAGPKGAATAPKEAAAPKDAGELEIDARRATIVSTLQQTEILRDILKPLEDMAGTGRKMAQQNVKLRATELAESGTVIRSRDMAEMKTLVKRALIMNGISPTRDQIDAASELWQALWACSRPAVILTGAAGVGKSSILRSMPKMAEHVNLINRKLNKSLRKLAAAKKTGQGDVAAGNAKAEGKTKRDPVAANPNASPSDPPGAVFEPPANMRGAAPSRRILNRQVPFSVYVNVTGSGKGKQSVGDGGTVASGASGSSKGTKATAVSEASNVSGASSDGGASVFSQRSAATKSSKVSEKSGATGGGASAIMKGLSGMTGIPHAAIEGSAFVVPAQEIEVVYTGACLAEHLIGSTDDKGSWLDGVLLRRLRVLAEGVRGSGNGQGEARSRHRACGLGTGDVCPPRAGKATSGFSHGCKSRLLVLDGPLSRLLEGMIAGDQASVPSLTGPLECRHSARCLLLPDGETLALDAWGHVAVETGDVRHLSPSTITGVAIVHLRADGPELVKRMREAWLKKLSRRKFQHPGLAGGTFRPVLLTTVSEFFRQEGFVEGGCCLEDTGDATKSAAPVESGTLAGTCVSRIKSTLKLLEGLLDILVEIDENAVVWEAEGKRADGRSTSAAPFQLRSKAWTKTAVGVRAVVGMSSTINSKTTTRWGLSGSTGGGLENTPEPPPDLANIGEPEPEESIKEDDATTTMHSQTESLVPPAISRQNELTPAEVQEVEKRLRVRTFLLCVYASIWGMGGHLVGEASRLMCSAFIRQSCPVELRQHVRESNLFDFVVDIRRAKLIPIGEDASACPGALPRGMWIIDPHWATQASELSCPLPPSLVIPSHRLSTVATAAYTLLRMEDARVLVEGPSGAGKTALLSHLLKVMGKGIPDIVAGESANSTPSSPAGPQTVDRALALEAGGCEKGFPVTAVLGEGDRVHNAAAKEGEGERKSEAEVNQRVHLLDRARRRMVEAAAKAATACDAARAAMEPGRERRRTVEGDVGAHQADTTGGQTANPSAEDGGGPRSSSGVSQRGGRDLPRSTVYLSMRRQAATDEIATVIGRALKREKDGVLESPPECTTVIFLDDVHCAQEPPGEGYGETPSAANCCTAETIRGMIDCYTPLGEVRISSTLQRIAKEERCGGGRNMDEDELSAIRMESGLPRLCQVHPDFSPRAPSGPGGDSCGRPPSSTAVLAARTRVFSQAGGPRPLPATSNPSMQTTDPGLAGRATASSAAASQTHLGGAGGRQTGGGAPTLPALSYLSHSAGPNAEQQGQQVQGHSSASSADRLWRCFSVLALDSPSASELRSIFSHVFSDAFAGDGPISSAIGRPASNGATTTKTTNIITSEVWKAVDAMGGVAAEFLSRLHPRLLKEASSSWSSSAADGGAKAMPTRATFQRAPAAATPGVGLAACQLDFFTLGRLLRPLVLGRSGTISTPAAVQRLFCHEIMREVVEPLRESWQRELAAFELARVVRERAFDIGIEAEEERCILETWQPREVETPPLWTNARGLVMAVAYWEQQATKAIMTQKTAGDNDGCKGTLGATRPHPGDNVSYLEVCSKKDDDMRNERNGSSGTTSQAGPARTMVAHGVLMNTKDVFSTSAITEHFARAVTMLKLSWPARPDGRPLVTPQDVANVCKCLRQLCLPWSPLVVLRSEDRGMLREGGPESAFRLACALEGAGIVVLDAGAGRVGTKIDRINGVAPGASPTGAAFLSFRTVLRTAVLSCIGKGLRGPYLEKAGGAGEDLRLYPGDSKNSDSPAFDGHTGAAMERGGGSASGRRFTEAVGPLVATQTVLLVKDAAHLWETGNGEWALRTFMDLVESGDVRRLFSDAELLELVQAEEEYQRRMATNTRRTSPKGISNATPRGAARPMTGGGPANAWEETPALGGSHEAEHTSSKGEMRWSCWTRSGTDFVYRRIVSCVRQSLTVALCLDDDEVTAFSPSFPALSTCPSLRVETWSARSMQLAAVRSLSAHQPRPARSAGVNSSVTPPSMALSSSQVGRQDGGTAAGGVACLRSTSAIGQGDEVLNPCSDSGKGGLCLWPGATHVNLVGGLAFGRFQSTVSAYSDPPISSLASSFPEGGDEQVVEVIKRDAKKVIEESGQLFDAWMAQVPPSCCVEVFQAVEACAGGKGDCFEQQGQHWSTLKARCFRAMAEEGRGPRPASLNEVLLLFKHVCRLACRRIVERAQTLLRALEAADFWGVHEARREHDKVQLKKRAKDVLKALEENNEHVRRVQTEKIKVQTFWSEEMKATQEQRQTQYLRTEELGKALQPPKAAFEASRDALSTLQEEDMEYLCALCLGAGVFSPAVGSSPHVTAAAQQRKKRGLHTEAPFIVETVAVMLGNMSGYPQWEGEWVRLKASPSAKIIRALLLDPAIVDRLNSFDPESEAGQKITALVIDKMNQRAEEASKKKASDGAASLTRGPSTDGGGLGGGTTDDTTGCSTDAPAAQYARDIPVLSLKLESRACGLLVAWVQASVLLVVELRRAEKIRAEILADSKVTRKEEERIRIGNADEVRPLDEELELRATFKSRLSTRQRTINHRSDLVKELDVMGGAIEDFAATCRQELDDLAATAELCAGDALCFANVACQAAHLPHTLRTIALNRARDAISKCGIPVSRPWVVGGERNDSQESTVNDDNVQCDLSTGTNAARKPAALPLGRFRLGNFIAGVLTNIMQLERWAYPPDAVADEDGGEDSGDESDGGRGWGTGGGDGLPFHPAFMDAAVLTLTTPKWPLILDPEDIALRWLRRVYPEQSRLKAPLPASMVSMEVIAACAARGEVLPVCFTEGGVHSDLILFLGSEVLPIGAGEDKDPRWQPSIKNAAGVAGNCTSSASDGFATVGGDPQFSTTVVLRPGFRLIIFDNSSVPSSGPSTSSSPLLFLSDFPDALAAVQLIRFGGVDSVGIAAVDDGIAQLRDADDERLEGGHADSAGGNEESSVSSSDEEEAQDNPVPYFVLAGMGLTRQPGFEMSRTMGARLEEEVMRALSSSSEMDVAAQQRTVGPVATLVRAQKEALSYSSELSATHEAVIALFATRHPCFAKEGPPCTPDATVPSGGEPSSGVSDDVERDQSRVLNNLVETLFAYKSTLENGVDTAPKSDRAAQTKYATAASRAEKVAHDLISFALRFLARSGDMLHALRADPVLYSPIYPGVRARINGAIRTATEAMKPQMRNEMGALARILVANLTQSMTTRVANDFKWVLPLAGLAVTNPGELPDEGWWDTCVALVGDRQSGTDTAGGRRSRLTLAKLFKMVTAEAGAGHEVVNSKLNGTTGSEKGGSLEATTTRPSQQKHVGKKLAQIRALIGSWLDRSEVDVSKLTSSEDDAAQVVVGEGGEDEDEEGSTSRRALSLSPQQWDFGFDTSTWARDQSATAVAALVRDSGLPFDPADGLHRRKKQNSEENDKNVFFGALSRLWAAATSDRASMNLMQAEEAKVFSGDEVLRRLVLLETTMNSVFARLPGFVMCEAGRWVEWIAEIRRSLSTVQNSGGDSASSGWLRFLLSHPPPAFESSRKVGDDYSSSSSSSSSSSDGGSGSDSDSDGSSSSERGSVEGSQKKKVNDKSADGVSTTQNAAAQPPIVTDEVEQQEETGGGASHNKVRRDSRERIKIKLGLLDELGMARGGQGGKNDVSAETRQEFSARASSLFGIPTPQTRGVALARNRTSSASATRALAGANTRSDPLEQTDKMGTTIVSAGAHSIVEDEDHETEEYKFITFVAESFRPQRDNSDWHKEANPEPGPPDTSKDTSSFAILGEKKNQKEAVDGTVAADLPVVAAPCTAEGRDESIDPKKEIVTGTPSLPHHQPNPLEKRPSDSQPTDSSPASGPDIKTSSKQTEQQDAHATELSGTLISGRDVSAGRWDELGRREANIKMSPSLRIAAFSATRVVKKKRYQRLEVPVEELGTWPQRWNESPLIGIILLLALAPDAHLAAKCASACLMAEGGRDNLHRSIVWQELKNEASIGDAFMGRIQYALESSRRWTPVVVMAPANDDLSDGVSRHFASVLSQIERVAQKEGISVTVHDASKSAHVLLSRGVLVSQARRTHKGHAKTRMEGRRVPTNVIGGPATANMTQSLWEVCIKAATEGGWVVINEFEGAAESVSLILDGIRRHSAVRCASTAATEEHEKLVREQRATNTNKGATRGGSADGLRASEGSPSDTAEPAAQQAGKPAANGALPATARKASAAARWVTTPGGARKTKAPSSRMCAEHPLLKALSAGEGGAMSTKAQSAFVAALRRPLPVPHKNFRVILLSTASPENHARDDRRSFGMGESAVVWWCPARVSVPTAATATAARRQTRGVIMESAHGTNFTVNSCRNEIEQELVSSISASGKPFSADAGVELITENFARIVEADANGQKVINMPGATINMHLAASIYVLLQTGAAGGSTFPAESSPGNMSSPSPGVASNVTQSLLSGFKEATMDGNNVTSKRQSTKSVGRVMDGLVHAVDGAVRASVVATELRSAPTVDLVAGVLDEEDVRVREARMASVVKTKANKRTE